MILKKIVIAKQVIVTKNEVASLKTAFSVFQRKKWYLLKQNKWIKRLHYSVTECMVFS